MGQVADVSSVATGVCRAVQRAVGACSGQSPILPPLLVVLAVPVVVAFAVYDVADPVALCFASTHSLLHPRSFFAPLALDDRSPSGHRAASPYPQNRLRIEFWSSPSSPVLFILLLRVCVALVSLALSFYALPQEVESSQPLPHSSQRILWNSSSS